MIKPEYLVSFSDKERQIIEILSRVVDIAGEIYLKQKNQAYPAGNLYPPNITREEFDQAAIRDPELKRFDTVVERMTASRLCAVPYNEKYLAEYARLKKLLQEAVGLAEHPAFKRYLKSLITCLTNGTPADYWQMMSEWVKTKNYAINFPFTYDEQYLDRLVGVKGSFNAGVFLEDAELSDQVCQPLKTLAAFKKTMAFPDRPKNFPELHTAVYRTVNHQGVMAEMKLRAWDIPNDSAVAEKVGTRQTIIREGVEREFANRCYPIARRLLPELIAGLGEDALRLGLFVAMTLHEISHNLARYEKERELEKYFSVFEEFKTCVLSMIWIDYLMAQRHFSDQQRRGALAMTIASDFSDIILAETFSARESYRLSALLQLNFLCRKGSCTVKNGHLIFDLNKLDLILREIFPQIADLPARGNLARAKKYVDQYGVDREWLPIIADLKKLIKIHV